MSDSYSIGVDLGGTNLRVAAYAAAHGLLETIQVPTRLADGREAVVRDLTEAVHSLKSRGFNGRPLVGIGVGSPGPLELPEGIIRNPPNLPGWDGFDLRHAIESALGCPVHLEGDGNAAALAEARLGVGRRYGLQSLAVLTLGTGVGSGFILNGRIAHGASGMGAEAGHILIKDVGGAPCGCGGFGCLEQYASATAIVRMARETMHADAPATAHDVFTLAKAGEGRALAVFEIVGHALAVALTALINTLSVPAYLLAGGVCEAWELFAPAMFRELPQRSYVYRLTMPHAPEPGKTKILERHRTYIMRAELGSAAGLLGACLLPFQNASGDTPSAGK